MSEPAEEVEFSQEPCIVINGVQLSQAQAMTVRVALGAYGIELNHRGLGNDETGKSICAGYLRCIHEVHMLMQIDKRS